MTLNSLQYSVYKGMTGKWGAVQFNLQEPHYFRDKQKDFTGENALDENGKLKDGWRIREGAVFLEITSTKDKNVYDWENKVTVALSVNDLGKVLLGLKTGEDVKIMHDPGAKSERAGAVQKYVSITSPKGTLEGCIVSVSETSGENKKSHTVPLSGDELLVLATLVQSAISRSLGW